MLPHSDCLTLSQLSHSHFLVHFLSVSPLLSPTHPSPIVSVMFRKHVVLACGGYSNKKSDIKGGNTDDHSTPHPDPNPNSAVIDTIEDYHLWLRILALHPCR